MEDATIFAGQNNQSPQSPAPAVVQTLPVSQNSSSSVPPQNPLDPSSGGYAHEGGGSGRIIKILAGLALFLILIIIAAIFIVPLIFSKPKKVTLTYWGLWEDKAIVEPVLREFSRNYPNITVEYAKQDQRGYIEKLKTRIPEGKGPDIYRFHNTWYPMLSKFLQPLPSDVITAKKIKEDYFPVVYQDAVKKGAVYGIPLGIDVLSLYVNSELITKAGYSPPKDWKEFETVSKKMTVVANGQVQKGGAAFGVYGNVAHAPDILSMIFAQNGVDFTNYKDRKKKIADALDYYNFFAKGNENSIWDKNLDNSTLAFAKGNVGLYFGYSWDYFTIKALNPNLDFKIVPVPQLSDKKRTIASYWLEGVSSKSKNQKEAMLLMNFLAKKETQEKLYKSQATARLFGEPYARKDLAKKLENDPVVSAFVVQGPYATSSFFAADTFDNGINSELNVYLENAVNSSFNNGTSGSATDTFVKGITQVLAKYGQK